MEFNEIINFLSGPNLYYIFFGLMILAGIGSPINGDLMMVFMGSLAGIGKASAEITIVLAISGLLLGDSVMFLLGSKFGFNLLKIFPFNKILNKKKIYRMNRFIKKKGSIIILMARFIPGTRTLTIFSSSVFKMKFYKFLIMDSLGLVILVPILVFLGKYFVKNIDQAKENLVFLFLIMIILMIISIYSSKKLFPEKNSI